MNNTEKLLAYADSLEGNAGAVIRELVERIKEMKESDDVHSEWFRITAQIAIFSAASLIEPAKDAAKE